MDQAPVQNVDIVRSLETPLGALSHLLQPGINVQRCYEPLPLLVNAVGMELNQVWTNIFENALDAMLGTANFSFEPSARNVMRWLRSATAVPAFRLK